ncbi:unnamed protein product [Allacma fusca]|uniref:Phosphoethanolamine N-methyltransferase n=1 Tax=Allacma fusca TaxID=39272 RepID=A0A8J2L808_9HEXA|nr:unnamed protein product [Allacma fusca]
MRKFWEQYDPTPKSMMLCSAANDVLEVEDRVQVLKTCPPLNGKSVLELGAGIGRFTTELAKVSRNVTAVDFIPAYVEQNKKTNGHFGNVKFLAADVTELELPRKSFDVIFSNWLLMYLDDVEVNNLIIKLLSWVKDGGYLFVRESCYRPSGDVKRDTNPTYYRSSDEYFRCLRGSTYSDHLGQDYVFTCQRAISMEAYIRHYGNPFQLGFVLQKMSHAADSYDSFQAFLDGSQYTEEGIRRYEFIFGKTYVSTGGQTTTQQFVKKLNLKPTDAVLDVGCGIGGSAFHMAREFGVKVHGVDLSTNMINMAIKYQGDMEEAVRKNVSFEMRDITKADFEENSFDVIYSRDTILHIGDKEALFSQFFKWLKPGGKLMISDYCHGDKEEYSTEYTNYVHQRGYHMLKVVDYGHLLETVGFKNVDAQDLTSTFIDILNTEAKRFVSQKEEFLTRFSLQDFEYILEGWNAKVRRCSAGDQAWGLFIAEKPL